MLVNILSHHALPITVCYPRNRTISVKEKRVNTNSIPHMQLTETFDEVFLLGHYINNGKRMKLMYFQPFSLKSRMFVLLSHVFLYTVMIDTFLAVSTKFSCILIIFLKEIKDVWQSLFPPCLAIAVVCGIQNRVLLVLNV